MSEAGKVTKTSGGTDAAWRHRINPSGQTVPVLEDVVVDVLAVLRRIEMALERIEQAIAAAKGL